MSNERKNRENDQLVTDAYKALANERAPDHLNQQLLRLAAREGRTRYSRARAWIRPMAWAATIGMSFAIVLELSRLPSIEPDSIGIALPDEDRADRVSKPDHLSKDEFVPQGMAVLREAEDMARTQAGPDQAPIAVRAETDDVPAEDVSAERFLAEQVSASEVAAEEADEFSAAASFAAVVEKKALRSGSACSLEVRESAESWWACIKTLRDDGQEDLADSEYEEFQQEFPDFVDPHADK